MQVPQHRAASSFNLSSPFHNGAILTLQSLVVDCIDQCSSRPLTVDEKFDNVDMAVGAGKFAWHDEAKQIAGSLKLAYGSRDSVDTAFRWTLVANMRHLESPAPTAFDEEYLKVCEYLELLDRCNYDVQKAATMPNAKELETFNNDSSFLDAWLLAAFQRRFCSTKAGRMGLAPGVALEGDLIAVVLGADAPFVLRSAEMESYILVGDYYVEGFMNGEALEGVDARLRDMHIQ